ncbi:S8 family serine peptidase [bacterium]|nr:S8 family serine peptidase [candidate division CSSED10-310 bacterium]
MKRSYLIALLLGAGWVLISASVSLVSATDAIAGPPALNAPAHRDMSWWPFDATMPYATADEAELSTVIQLDCGSFDTRLTDALPIPMELTAPELLPEQSGMFLVQFAGPITEVQKAAVRSIGAELYDYWTHWTFSTWMTPEQAASVQALEGVRWIGRFHPAYRIHSTFGTRDLRLMERVQSDQIQAVIQLLKPAHLAEVADRVARSGGTVTAHFPNAIPPFLTARIHPESVFELARMETIRRIEEEGEFYQFNDETQEVLQSGSVAGGTPVWNGGLHGEGQILGHMDSGIDADHCFFIDASQPLPTSTVNVNHRKIICYRTYANGQAYDGCDNGHGTHTAGTAAGFTMNAAGTPYIGLAYGAKITAADVGTDDWISCLLGLLSVPSDISVCYTDAYGDGARIHTNSWGSTDNTYDSMAEQTDTFMWNHKDFLIFYANGNSGPDAGTMGTPATSKNIVAVGGCNNEPDQNQIWASSSRGPVNGSNRMAPALMAPSTDGSGFTAGIDSSASDGETTGETCGFIGSGYQGTSMACPAAAGCALLVRQYFTDGYYPTGIAVPANGFIPSAALIRGVMINGAADMTGVTHRPNNDQGWGRVHLDNSLYFSGDTAKLLVADDPTGLQTGDMFDTPITVNSNAAPLRITLTWTDYPGNNLVNDLDLELIKDNQTWYGNNFTNGWTGTGTTVDRSLPTECIFLDTTTVTSGTYTIRVKGFNVPQGEPGGTQPFALAITGDISTQNPCINNGDVNLDGSLTSGDAQMAFFIALGTITPTYEEECAADCTGDGSVTAGDAQAIFQTVLGITSCVDPL